MNWVGLSYVGLSFFMARTGVYLAVFEVLSNVWHLSAAPQSALPLPSPPFPFLSLPSPPLLSPCPFSLLPLPLPLGWLALVGRRLGWVLRGSVPSGMLKLQFS